MKRILISLSTIALVAAFSVGTTGAFFSDTETSAANVFTAGSIDLKIDHTLSTYNGSSDLVVVSDAATTFTGDDGAGNAVPLSFVHPAWTAGALIPGATWIWATNPVSNPSVDQTDTFTRTFTWTGSFASASMQFAADNFYDVYVNGNLVGSDHNLIVGNFQSDHLTDVTADIVQGVNTITFIGKNFGINGSAPADNPAGIIFKLVVHGQQTWVTPVDLTSETFWHFNDVKPQDTGRDVISLHAVGNDAWTCMVVKNIKNDENTYTQPEINAGDATPGPVGNGELGQYLHLFLWHDINGDGVYNPPTETPLAGTIATPTIFDFSGAALNVPIHDSTTGNGPQLGNSTEDVGAAWCAGVLTIDGGGAISCDGTTASNPNINQSQTDSTSADLTFYATQNRNQPTFKCSDVNP